MSYTANVGSRSDEIMKMKGFMELLANIESRMLQGEFKETFDSPTLSEGDASRILNDHIVDEQLCKMMMSELPQEIFNPPLLDMEAYGDDTHPNHQEVFERYQEISKLLKPYFDKMTFMISLELLDSDRSELGAPIQTALATNYQRLSIDKEKLIVGLYSSIFAIFSQATASVQSAKSAVMVGSHGPKRRMTNEAIAYTQHFSMIQKMIDQYQNDFSLGRIRDTVPDTDTLIAMAKDYVARGQISQAIQCYKIAHEQDPKKLPDVGNEMLNTSIERLSEIAVSNPVFTNLSYKELHTTLESIISLKSAYEVDRSDENFNRLMTKVDSCIASVQTTCETKKSFWEKQVKPVFRALLASVILIILGAGASRFAPAYYTAHQKERKAVVDSFLNQDKELKNRLLDFKKQIEVIRQIGLSAEQATQKKDDQHDEEKISEHRHMP